MVGMCSGLEEVSLCFGSPPRGEETYIVATDLPSTRRPVYYLEVNKFILQAHLFRTDFAFK